MHYNAEQCRPHYSRENKYSNIWSQKFQFKTTNSKANWSSPIKMVPNSARPNTMLDNQSKMEFNEKKTKILSVILTEPQNSQHSSH